MDALESEMASALDPGAVDVIELVVAEPFALPLATSGAVEPFTSLIELLLIFMGLPHVPGPQNSLSCALKHPCLKSPRTLIGRFGRKFRGFMKNLFTKIDL
jgi:hypothetical protein